MTRPDRMTHVRDIIGRLRNGYSQPASQTARQTDKDPILKFRRISMNESSTHMHTEEKSKVYHFIMIHRCQNNWHDRDIYLSILSDTIGKE